MAFAVKHAEAMFIPGMEARVQRQQVEAIRQQARDSGRDPTSIKLISGMHMVVAATDAEAAAKYGEYLSYADNDGTLALFCGWYGVDIDEWGDDEDFRFAEGFTGAVQGMLNAWSATVPGGADVKWTKTRIARELALGGPHPKAIGSAATVADALEAVGCRDRRGWI